MDPAELRLKNLLRPEQFPYTTPTGWEYDSGDYATTMRVAMDIAATTSCAASRRRSAHAASYMGIGISFFTEGVGAGPRKHMDILGLGMADGCDLRVHPTGKAQVRLSVQTQGQGHETTFAQIVAHELGIPPEDIEVIHGDTDNTPFGLGTYGSRSTPVSGAAAAMVARTGARQGEAHRRGEARVRARRPRVGARPLVREGRSRARPHDPGDRDGRALLARAARGRRGSPRRAGGLQPAQPHLPVRLLHLRRRRGPRHRSGEGAPVHRGRRLRHAHQPDDRRGTGPRRSRRRRRDGAHGGHRVRRGRQQPRRLVHGLPAADRDGVPRLGARRDGHAVAAPPDRRQGGRRVGDRGFARGHRQRRDRRDLAVRRHATRTCRSPRPTCGARSRAVRCAPTWRWSRR